MTNLQSKLVVEAMRQLREKSTPSKLLSMFKLELLLKQEQYQFNHSQLKVVLNQLQSSHVQIRLDAANLLELIADPRSLEAVLDRLKIESDVNTLTSLCEVLEVLGNPKAIIPLKTLLRHQDDAVRYFTLCALTKLESAFTLEELVALTRDKSWDVRQEAYANIPGHIKNIRQRKNAKAWLYDRLKTERDAAVKISIAEVIFRLYRDKSMIEQLMKWKSSKSIRIKYFATSALERIESNKPQR